MRKKILTAPCLLLSLFTSLSLCTGRFGNPITDDVSKLSILKQNIPSDYEILVDYIPKEIGGTCWEVLNIFPLELSLRKLAEMFGAFSSNKANIVDFISMVKNVRFTFDQDDLERMMKRFRCHYQQQSLASGLYFDYIDDILKSTAEGTSDISCVPPPCLNSQPTPEGQEESDGYSWQRRAPILLALIPFTACVVLIVWLVKSGRRLPACNSQNRQMASSDTISTVSISIPLQTLSHAADSQPAGEEISKDESG